MYIEKEIAIVRIVRVSGSSISSFFMMLAALFFVILMIISIVSVSNADWIYDAQRALDSNSIEDKLNFLIHRYITINELNLFSELRVPLFVGGIGVGLIVIVPIVYSLLAPLYDYFCIGKEKDVFEKKQKLRQNVFWLVVGGFLLVCLQV